MHRSFTILASLCALAAASACTPYSAKRAEVEQKALGYRQASARACEDIKRNLKDLEPYREDLAPAHKRYLTTNVVEALKLCEDRWLPTDIESAQKLFEVSFDVMKMQRSGERGLLKSE